MKTFDRYTVDDIKVVEARGPWESKSGGALNVSFALGSLELAAFLDVDNPEFTKVEAATGIDIRGLRSYRITDIPEGSIGGQEYHRARTEYVQVLAGRALWLCSDNQGNEREYELDGRTGVITPPGITHSYEALEEGTGLEVVCNTLFIPEDPRTHDTFRPPIA